MNIKCGGKDVKILGTYAVVNHPCGCPLKTETVITELPPIEISNPADIYQPIVDAIVAQVDYEHVSSGTICKNGTWHYTVVNYANGVQTGTTEVDSGVSCEDPLPVQPKIDKEIYCDTSTKTLWEKTCLYVFNDSADLTDVSVTVLSENNLGKPCVEENPIEDLIVECDGKKSLFTSGCNDDRRDKSLDKILDAINNLPDHTVVLDNILSSVVAIDENTDTVEALLADIKTLISNLDQDDDATALATINASILSAISELQDIDANTDTLEALLSTLNTSVISEGDQTQAILTNVLTALNTINTKLNETCAGSPMNVNVCNQVDISGLQTTLDNILTSTQAIDANTDTVEALLGTINTTLGTLDSDDDGTALATINTSVLSAISELQDIDANTDTLEALLTLINTSVLNEGDQTQLLLTDIDTKLSEVDLNLTTQVGSGNIPAGFKSVTISNLTGITTINGGFQLGNGRRPDSISFGGTRGNFKNELLPAYALAGGTRQWIGHL